MDDAARTALRSLLSEHGLMEAAEILIKDCGMSGPDLCDFRGIVQDQLDACLDEHLVKVVSEVNDIHLWWMAYRGFHHHYTIHLFDEVARTNPADCDSITYSLLPACNYIDGVSFKLPWVITPGVISNAMRAALEEEHPRTNNLKSVFRQCQECLSNYNRRKANGQLS